MLTLNMKGPYKLTTDEINKRITRVSPGNYALGYVEDTYDGKTFIVKYVGRADSDVAGRLKDHVKEKYSYFKFSYASSSLDAFKKECENYHDFGEDKKLDNKIHPDRPKNTNWKCPRCSKFN